MSIEGALRLALERSGVAVCALDRQGRYVLVNEAAAALLGVPRDSLLGRPYREHVEARHREPFDRAFEGVISDGASRRFASADRGRHYEVELSDGGEVILVLWRELTEVVRRHDATADERDLWRTLFEQAPAQIGIMVGPEHRYLFVNERARAAVGGRTDLVGKTAREAFPELAGSPLYDIADEVYRSGRPWVGHEIPVSFDVGGEPVERFLTFIYQPYRGGGGEVAGLMSFGFDVTDAVRARRRLETLFEANLIGNIFWRLDGTITRANDAFLAMLGYTRADLDAGRLSWRALTPPEYVRIDDEQLRELVERRIHAPYEKEYLRKDGSRAPILIASALFPESELEGVSYVVDLSTVKATELRMGELLGEARAASRAKDEFLAMLGHELRNPLAPITTALDLMRLRGIELPERSILERQVGHVSRLVDDLLDVAKIARGELSIERRQVELGRVIERAVEMAEPLIEQHRHRLTLTAVEPVPTVVGDEARLAQAVANLLVNAARYTPDGGHIELSVDGEGAAGPESGERRARIRVRDDGQGIPPALLERVFELFVRAPDERMRRPGGLGLGLAIVRNIARVHGGEVTAASPGPGQGSEFTLTLPAVAALPEATTAPAPVARSGARRVLVVDDNVDAAELLAALIEHHGHRVEVAHSGPEALRAVERFTPDVAVLDLGLPVMDGFEIARSLRARLGHRLRLVALTGYGQARDREATAIAGFDAHLVKPVGHDELLRAVVSGRANRPTGAS